MLRQRVVTGVLLAAGALAAILLLPVIALALLLGAVSILALWEWADLAGLQSVAGRVSYCLAGAVGLSLLASISGLGNVQGAGAATVVLVVTAAGWVLALVAVKGFPASADWWGRLEARAVIGLVAVLPTWLALVTLLGYAHGRMLILFLLALVACADIGAYAVGRRFGQRKLAPTVSPGKTWEGFWGGLATGLVFTSLIWLFFWQEQIGWLLLMGIAVVTLIASVTGDLLESMVKRYRGIKDSGTILPGHGGILDRLDSLCAAAPLFALGLLLAGW